MVPHARAPDSFHRLRQSSKPGCGIGRTPARQSRVMAPQRIARPVNANKKDQQIGKSVWRQVQRRRGGQSRDSCGPAAAFSRTARHRRRTPAQPLKPCSPGQPGLWRPPPHLHPVIPTDYLTSDSRASSWRRRPSASVTQRLPSGESIERWSRCSQGPRQNPLGAPCRANTRTSE